MAPAAEACLGSQQQGAAGPPLPTAAPQPSACPFGTRLHRRMVGLVEARLERRGRLRQFTLAEVAAHNSKDDAWIVVDGKVFDITHHVLSHAGWTCGCSTSQLLAILRTLGTDCTEEVLTLHSPKALARFAPYLVGVLAGQGDSSDGEESDSTRLCGSRGSSRSSSEGRAVQAALDGQAALAPLECQNPPSDFH